MVAWRSRQSTAALERLCSGSLVHRSMLSPTSERVPPDWHSLGRVVAWLDQFERKGGMNITVPMDGAAAA